MPKLTVPGMGSSAAPCHACKQLGETVDRLRRLLVEYYEADAAAMGELQAIFPEWINPEASDRHERTRKLLGLPPAQV